MLTFRVLVALCKSKVNDIDVIFCDFCASNEEVVGFDVAVDDALLVDLLNSLNLH